MNISYTINNNEQVNPVDQGYYKTAPFEARISQTEELQKFEQLNKDLAQKFTNQYSIIKELGQGLSGKVVLVKDKVTGDEFAAKVVAYAESEGQKSLPSLTETRTLIDKGAVGRYRDKASKAKKIPSKTWLYLEASGKVICARPDMPLQGVIKFTPASEEERKTGQYKQNIEKSMLHMFMDPNYGIELSKLRAKVGANMSINIILKIMYEALLSLEFCHSQDLIINDFKSANTMVLNFKDYFTNPSNIKAKMMDHGMTAVVTDSTNKRTLFSDLGRGKGALMGSPHAIDFASQFGGYTSQAGDILAWGLMMLECLGETRNSMCTKLGIDKNNPEHYEAFMMNKAKQIIESQVDGTFSNDLQKQIFNEVVKKQKETDTNVFDSVFNKAANNAYGEDSQLIKQILEKIIKPCLNVGSTKRPTAYQARKALEKIFSQHDNLKDFIIPDKEINMNRDDAIAKAQSITTKNDLIKIKEATPLGIENLRDKESMKDEEFFLWLDRTIVGPKFSSIMFDIQQSIKQELIKTKFYPQESKNYSPEEALYRADKLANQESYKIVENIKGNIQKIYPNYDKNYKDYFAYLETLSKYIKFKNLNISVNNQSKLRNIHKFIPGAFKDFMGSKTLNRQYLDYQEIAKAFIESGNNVGNITAESINSELDKNIKILSALNEVSKLGTVPIDDSFIQSIAKYFNNPQVIQSPETIIKIATEAQYKVKPALVKQYKNALAEIGKILQEKKIKSLSTLYNFALGEFSLGESLDSAGFDFDLHNWISEILSFKGDTKAQLEKASIEIAKSKGKSDQNIVANVYEGIAYSKIPLTVGSKQLEYSLTNNGTFNSLIRNYEILKRIPQAVQAEVDAFEGDQELQELIKKMNKRKEMKDHQNKQD